MLAALLIGVYFAYPWLRTRSNRSLRLFEFFQDPAAHAGWMVQAGQRCGEAPFLIPTDSYIGFIWGDVFRPGHTHQGLDMFGGQAAGLTPVYAAYAGYLTRLPDWKSSVIIRIPDDPLQPGRQIWTYYTHMADRDGNTFIAAEFPPGTADVFVEAGTLLGYQGDFSGDPFNPTGVHLHFSIVLDQGASAAYPYGWFTNELDVRNTLDPSPYFGLPLNASENPNRVPVCADVAGEG
jgi:hypothetical protein